MKKIIHFLKAELKKSRYIFFMLLVTMTYNIQQINSIGWGGWVLYATIAVFAFVSNNLAGGITLEEVKALSDLVKNVTNALKPALPKKRRKSTKPKGRKARKSKGAVK
ncbi:hypothetical protein B1757_13490 [Acidithiobacillus marinus]|uniref:Uncharacterized protein n=1 Tax=Acidithiobacillus marinus TaxID=187490 RepID=A0A2I1DIP2_9PROT|nr:hypothetical protein [Acidithiobacillus marinus]PKY09736.1 hypothetical protein B1757_13490 [Acidithiobacillus marinus]